MTHDSTAPALKGLVIGVPISLAIWAMIGATMMAIA